MVIITQYSGGQRVEMATFDDSHVELDSLRCETIQIHAQFALGKMTCYSMYINSSGEGLHI